jgi:hypothetical protein
LVWSLALVLTVEAFSRFRVIPFKIEIRVNCHRGRVKIF